jgi:hypothetical protein
MTKSRSLRPWTPRYATTFMTAADCYRRLLIAASLQEFATLEGTLQQSSIVKAGVVHLTTARR